VSDCFVRGEGETTPPGNETIQITPVGSSPSVTGQPTFENAANCRILVLLPFFLMRLLIRAKAFGLDVGLGELDISGVAGINMFHSEFHRRYDALDTRLARLELGSGVG
jgi:hypothetical protein